MSTRSLVTGGSGFVGGVVTRTLLDRGERVRVLDLHESTFSAPNLEHVRGSILDRDALREAMRGVDVVYHLAAISGLWTRDPSAYDRVNHQGTRAVLEEAGRARVRSVVHASSAVALARRARTRPLSTTEPPEGGSPALPDPRSALGPYARSKILAERAVYEATRAGVPCVVTTITTPIGPGDPTPTPPTQLLIDLMRGRVPAMMDMPWHLSDVRDIAHAICNAPDMGVPGRRYILRGETWTTERLLRTLSSLCQRPMPRVRAPYALAIAIASMGEASSRITGRPPRAFVEGVRLARARMDLDSDPGATDLGVTMRPVEQSLSDAIAWLRENAPGD